MKADNRQNQRLTRRQEFSNVVRKGRPYSNHLLVLRAVPNSLAVTRFGFAVSLRVGKAVVRNRVKRRLREATRQSQVKEGWDVVVSARREAAEASFHQLKGSVETLLHRVGVMPMAPGTRDGDG